MSNETFPYRPLQQGQIRVLRRRSEKKLSFDLRIVKLKDKPAYAALSYCWGNKKDSRGNPIFPHSITVDGSTFWITENLHQAVTQFDQGIGLDDKTEPFRRDFWIDAICINQSKKARAERSMQVQMMTDIYERAERIYVWLGPAHNEIDNHAAVVKMRDLQNQNLRANAKALGGYKPWWWPREALDSASTSLGILRDIGESEVVLWKTRPELSQSAWRGIIHMWKSEWWSRAWAYQEATVVENKDKIFIMGTTPKLPKSKIRIVTGERFTTWTELNTAFSITQPIFDSKLAGTEIIAGSASQFSRVSQIRVLRKSEEPVEMLDALDSFRLASATDPRDKVYAVLGLVSTAGRAQFQVDYEQSIIDVYIGVVRYLATTGPKSLDFLGYTIEVHNTDTSVLSKEVDWAQLPSWAPNWHLNLEITPLPKMLFVQAPMPKGKKVGRGVDRRMNTIPHTINRIQTYNACGRFDTSDVIINGHHLSASGVHVDTVEETMRFSWEKDLRTATVTRWKLHLSCNRYPDGNEFDRVLRQVHCGDVRWELIPRHTPVARGYEIENSLLFHDPQDLSDGERRSQSTMRITLRKMTRNRALCLTAGNRLALVPYLSQKGDKVCMLYGGQVLYVLRPTGPSEDVYRYLGEAYVHDLMDGDVSRMCDAGDLRVERFVIE